MNIKRDSVTATEQFEFDRLEKALEKGPVLDPFYEIPQSPSKRVFECASGTGLDVAIPLALAGHDVTASEYTPSAREDLNQLCIKYGVEIRIVPIDFSNPILPASESFDYIFARNCLQHHQSLNELENTIRIFQDRTSQYGEHRFSCLANHYMKDGDSWMPIPNISSLPMDDYLAFFIEVYSGWKISIDYKDYVSGTWYVSACKKTPARHGIMHITAQKTNRY